MDIGRGIGAPFKDPSWITKALLGGVWVVVPFTGFALTGYYLDYIRNCAHGRETPLPEWSLFGRFWVRGLLASIAFFIYMLPALVIVLIGFIPVIGLAATDPYAFERGFGSAVGGGACLAILLAVIYSVAIWIFAAAAFVHYAMHEQFGVMFSFGEIKNRLSTKEAGYFTALVMSVAIMLGASFVGGLIGGILNIVPVLGAIASIFVSGATGFVGALMAAHLFGQYAARAYGLPGPLSQPAAHSAQGGPPSVAPDSPPAAQPPTKRPDSSEPSTPSTSDHFGQGSQSPTTPDTATDEDERSE